MIALISEQIAKAFEDKTKIKAIALPKYDKLDAPVASHPDMLICVIEDTIFLYDEYYYKNKGLFEQIPSEYKIALVEKKCEKEYPNDIALNVLIIGKKLFCNKEYTAKEIIEYALSHDYKIINVKQGYSACSTMVIDENNAITGDKGMYIALTNEGINTLLISPEKIILEGYNHGFIGGSVGVFEKTAYFLGEISYFPDYNAIVNFLNNVDIKILSTFQGRVSDFGGIKFL